MKLRNLRDESSPRLMIIPMIDIIFFLLVFFMMSTIYMVEQQTIALNLPHASSTQKEIPQNISVTVTFDGQIFFEEENISLALLQKRAQIELSRQKDLVFLLRSDKQVEYGKVIAVLDELKAAGAQRVAVATERKDK